METADLYVLIIPLVFISLYIFTIVDIIKNKNLETKNKILWLIGITIVSGIGLAGYFLFGRKRKPETEN
jgi:nitric oxide reductase large subunit